MTQTLYWVCWYKHEAIQHAVAGPFLSWGEADEVRKSKGEPAHYVIGESEIQIKDDYQ